MTALGRAKHDFGLAAGRLTAAGPTRHGVGLSRELFSLFWAPHNMTLVFRGESSDCLRAYNTRRWSLAEALQTVLGPTQRGCGLSRRAS